ncbi:UNVERIFIED_CONTAM: transmembrane protein, putative [Hammondia hammondi]|eukprot:XP_008886337.1 transmembrane protein, putative [Hammondia hammondi]
MDSVNLTSLMGLMDTLSTTGIGLTGIMTQERETRKHVLDHFFGLTREIGYLRLPLPTLTYLGKATAIRKTVTDPVTIPKTKEARSRGSRECRRIVTVTFISMVATGLCFTGIVRTVLIPIGKTIHFTPSYDAFASYALPPHAPPSKGNLKRLPNALLQSRNGRI